MRARFVCGLAAAMLLVKAMPAMATSWDICLKPVAVESGGDLNVSVEGETVGSNVLPIFFSTVVNVYPAGTFEQSTAATPRVSCNTHAAPVGTFFARAGLVANLPTAISKKLTDVYYVDWLFRIAGTGQVGTSGVIKSVNPGVSFLHIITGSSGGLTAATGTAEVLVLSNAGDKFHDTVDAFEISVP
jgi:hypothetical protein